jgi:hypothetical protein
MGLIKKILLCVAFASPAFSQELVCAPNFEIIGLNADYGKYAANVLKDKMNVKANLRQLFVADSVFATDNIVRQMAWAKSRGGCSHLLQITLMRIEESVQANVRLIDLNSRNYVLKKFYNANSPTDLPAIFEQIENALQEPNFTQLDTIVYSDTNLYSLKREPSYLMLSFGRFYSQKRNQQDAYIFNSGYFWDSKSVWNSTRFWGEAFMGFGLNTEMYDGFYELGFRILYPFSKSGKGFYFGSGGGISYKFSNDNTSEYALFIENTASFLIWGNHLWRIEANIAAFFYDKPIAGGGLRIVREWEDL